MNLRPEGSRGEVANASGGRYSEHNEAQRSKVARVSSRKQLLGTARGQAASPREQVQVLSPQPKKFLGLVPRIFFYIFTLHFSLFTNLCKGIFLEVISNSE